MSVRTLSLKRASAIRRGLTAAMHIPCTTHVSEIVVRTKSGDYLQALRVEAAMTG
jgi:hypothetical protein